MAVLAGGITEGSGVIGGTPSGAAGGDLSGTYPNPAVVDDSHSHTAATLPATMPPSAHAISHQPGGSDAMAVDAAAATGSLRTLGTGAAQAAAGSDSRFPIASRLAADFTNATITMAAVGLSVPVTSGRKYVFQAVLMITDASGLEGVNLDWDASTAAATYFRCFPDDGSVGFFSVGSSGYTTALATDITGTGFVDEGLILRGTIEPSSTGTLALRAAQSSHIAGLIRFFRGSSLTIWETSA